MLRIFILIQMICWGGVFSLAHAQSIPQRPNKTNKEGLRQGKWTVYYNADGKETSHPDSLTTYRLLTYKNGKPQGEVIHYYTNGQVQMYITSLISENPDKYQGIVTWHREDGSKHIQHNYDENGNQTEEIYYNLDGSVAEENWGKLDQLGLESFKQRKYSESVEIFKKSILQAEKEFGQNADELILAINNLAFVYRRVDSLDLAEQLFLKTAQILQKHNDTLNADYANILENLALIYRSRGLFENSVKTFLDAKNIYEIKVGKDNPGYISVINGLAGAYRSLGKYSLAEPLYLESIHLIKKSNQNSGRDLAITLNNLALFYSETGRYQRALQFYIDAKTIYESISYEQHPYYAIALNGLGSVFHRLERYHEAIESYKKAKEIYENSKLENYATYAQILNNLALSLTEVNQLEEAEELYLKCKELRLKLLGDKHPYYATTLGNLADLYQLKKEYEKSYELYLKSKNIIENTYGKEHFFYIHSINNMAGYFETRNMIPQSAQLFSEIIDLKLSDYARNFAFLQEEEKRLYIDKDNPIYNNLQNFIVGLGQKVYANSQKEDVSVLNNLLINWLNLRLSTKGLLLSSSQKMRERILNSNDTSLVNSFNRWQLFKNQIAKAGLLTLDERQQKGIDLDAWQQEAAQMEKEISLKSSDFQQGFQSERITAKNLQAALKPGEAALEMIRMLYKESYETSQADTIYVALLLTAQSAEAPEMIILEQGAQMETSFFKDYKEAIHRLRPDQHSYQRYWQTIYKKLKQLNIQKVYFSPDGVYYQINLNTLQNPQTQKFVLDEIEVHQVNSTRDIVSIDKQKTNLTNKSTTNAVLLGRPTYLFEDSDYQDYLSHEAKGDTRYYQPTLESLKNAVFKDLPGTETEVNIIDSLLQSAGIASDKFIQREADEKRIKKLSNPKILHIATHGYFAKASYNQINVKTQTLLDTLKTLDFDLDSLAKNTPQKPQPEFDREEAMLRSGLVLSGVMNYFRAENKPDIEDGLLTALEVSTLNLDSTDLVVLSACETALGEVAPGEGVYGLQRAFQVSGAKSIMMSLWKVSDEVTKDFMIYFYQEWINSKDKRKAFKNAQVKIRERYKAPYYWGGFVMVGD